MTATTVPTTDANSDPPSDSTDSITCWPADSSELTIWSGFTGTIDSTHWMVCSTAGICRTSEGPWM